MKITNWAVMACATLALAGCATMSAEELRPKLAAANVEMAVKSSIKEIPFYTKTQEVGQAVASTGGIAGLVVGLTLTAAGQVNPVPINDGFSAGVAGAIRGKIAHARPGAIDSYRIDVSDGALLRNAGGDLYSLNYGVMLTVLSTADNKAVSTIACTGTGPDRLTEGSWRNAQDVIQATRKLAIEQCSAEFIAKLAPADAFVAEPHKTQQKKKRKK